MITVIGLDGSPLSRRAAEAVAGATLLVGGRRHLAVADWFLEEPASATGPDVVVMGPLRPALDALAAHDGDAVVLASGDPGFFGIVRALRERRLDCVVLPAVSSVALAFARAGLPWDDAVVVSAHGRELHAAANVCRAYPKVAVLTGPGQGPAEIGAALAGWPRRLLVAEDLGGADERITECTPAGSAARTWTDPNVVLALACPAPPPRPASAPVTLAPPDPPATSAPPAPSHSDGEFVIKRLVSSQRHQSFDHEAGGRPSGLGDPTNHTGPSGQEAGGPEAGGPGFDGQRTGAPGFGGPEAGGPGFSGPGPGWCWPLGSGIGDEGWALPEEAFEHRDSMVTKPEVRALALARLAPRPGALIWDVGAGSGSVAVECARFGAAVIAVERDPAQCARVAANAGRHRAEVRIVAGAAPEALDGLPDPDAVFVGGGGLTVVAAVAARRPARIVLALAAVQRVGQAAEMLGDAGYQVDGTLLQASRLAPLPDGAHRLAAANPVFLLWAQLSPHHGHGQLEVS
jgi:precorrin-6Y C5,15-methyltransferase (decarboxylating)